MVVISPDKFYLAKVLAFVAERGVHVCEHSVLCSLPVCILLLQLHQPDVLHTHQLLLLDGALPGQRCAPGTINLTPFGSYRFMGFFSDQLMFSKMRLTDAIA